MGISSILAFLLPILAGTVGSALADSPQSSPIELLVTRVERVSPEEVRFQVKVTNLSDRSFFLNGIRYESESWLYPVYLQQWVAGEGWKIVAPCVDVPPPHVILLKPGETMSLDPVLKLPLPAVCKERTVRLEGRFRYRLDYFEREEQARAYVKKLFSPNWKEARAPFAVSEPFEIPPAEDEPAATTTTPPAT